MNAYTLEQVGELVQRAVLLAGEAFATGDLREAHAELSFSADLIYLSVPGSGGVITFLLATVLAQDLLPNRSIEYIQ
jgi:hypothetical protein